MLALSQRVGGVVEPLRASPPSSDSARQSPPQRYLEERRLSQQGIKRKCYSCFRRLWNWLRKQKVTNSYHLGIGSNALASLGSVSMAGSFVGNSVNGPDPHWSGYSHSLDLVPCTAQVVPIQRHILGFPLNYSTWSS